jgi:anti-anti-sigma regulatory factor
VLRITLVANDGVEATLRAEGQLVAEWASLLEAECLSLLERFAAVRLDLSAVSYLDAAGAAVLAALVSRHVELLNHSSLLGELITDRGAEWTTRP